jgi:ABC-type bacteriocin/lantibiotic exporter with double-glycine peptidase domain
MDSDYVPDLLKYLKTFNNRKTKSEKLNEDVNKALDRRGQGQEGDQRHVSKKRESFVSLLFLLLYYIIIILYNYIILLIIILLIILFYTSLDIFIYC